MSGGDWLEQHQQETWPEQEAIFNCPTCPECEMADWISGPLDPFIQSMRQFSTWSDTVLIIVGGFALILLLIFTPITRRILGAFVNVIKSAWEATKRRK